MQYFIFSSAPVLIITLMVTASTATDHTSCSDHSDCITNSLLGERVPNTPFRSSSGTIQMVCDHGRCTCPPYHLQVNGTTCLPGRLLGFKCDSDAQCGVRVPQSGCVQGVCRCSDGYTAYRRANCLPAAPVGGVCRTQGQCRASSPHSYCRFSIPRVLGHCYCGPDFSITAHGLCAAKKLGLGSACTHSRQCNRRVLGAVCKAVHNSSAPLAVQNHITAIWTTGFQKDEISGGVCDCPDGYARDNHRCILRGKEIGEASISLGQRCSRDTQCQAADPYTHCNDGVCDCTAATPRCSASNTGCYPGTFQCVSDGRCISPHYVCDGLPQCSDHSDESVCQGRRCSPQSFRCPSGRCISRGFLCDGVKHCDDGADEERCHDDCPVSTFKCGDGQCLPGYVFCNAKASCGDASDEDHNACILGAPRLPYCPFRCGNGRCRSESVLCSGRDGCGDNSDEDKCEVCSCPAV
ncbi:Low-density lipoprotein (LDL) receptor class A repeat [Trinorchestia longiramus]|nr:Low-density lipoprotein (LDL) receptor class A repeat [Trinorchestia longiramus]